MVSALPVLVEWGHVISKLLVGGLAGLSLLGYRTWRNRRDLRPAREDARRMSLSVAGPREGPIAVRGVYRTARQDRWLDCAGQRVLLVGDLAIVRGSAATWKRGERTYALRDGDPVFAIGTMTRSAGTDATGYRESAGGWQLGPSAGESAIQLCVTKPVACPRPLWPIRGALVLAIAGTVAYFGLGLLGIQLVAKRDYPHGAYLDDGDVSTFAAEVAAALPRHRDNALGRFETDLQYQPQTDHVLSQRIAMARRTHCWQAVALLHELNRFDEAIETANACEHPEYAAYSLVSLARYEEAAALPVGGPLATPLAAPILAGRWHEAAAALEREPRYKDPEGTRCLARYLRALAAGNVDNGDTSSTSTLCRVIAGVFATGEQEEHDEHVVIARWAYAGGPPGFSFTHELARWLTPHVAPASTDFTVHALRAHRALDVGRYDDAAAEVAKAIAAPPGDAPRYAAWLRRHLTHWLALRTGKPIQPFEPDREPYYSETEEAALIRAGEDPRRLSLVDRRFAAALAAAMAGDGLPLARVIEAGDPNHIGLKDDHLLAVAPSVTAHREELVRAIRNRRPRGSGWPPSVVHELAIERDLFRMLGDPAEAARLQAIIDRHAKALADPVRLEALLLTQVRP